MSATNWESVAWQSLAAGTATAVDIAKAAGITLDMAKTWLEGTTHIQELGEIYQRFSNLVLRNLSREGANPDLAEDMAAEGWSRIIHNMQTGINIPRNKLRGYYTTVCLNACIDVWRRERNHKRNAPHPDDDTAARPTLLPPPDKPIEDNDIRNHLNACVEALSPKYQKVIHHGHHEERSFAEYARQEGRSKGWVSGIYHGALTLLADCLERKGVTF